MKLKNYTLIIMRHSKAEPAGRTTDFDRELTPVGRRKALNAAKYLTQNAVSPEVILSSKATRALQTADIIANAVGVNGVISKKSLYLAGVQEFINVLQSKSLKTKSQNLIVMIVAHDPTVTDTAYELSAKTPSSKEHRKRLAQTGMSTASMAILTSTDPFELWSKQSAELVDLVNVLG